MEWNDILVELIQFVEQAAPMVWAIARRQVLVHAAQNILWVIGSGITAVCLFRLGRASWQKYKEDKYSVHDMGAFFSYAGAAVCATVALGILGGVIGRFINPDYYAIHLLMQWAQ